MQGLQGLQEDSEKYISFSLGQLLFIDSIHRFNFMASSLNKLVKACPKESFTLLRSKFSDESDYIDLLLQKGIYLYEYVDSFHKFLKNELPPIEEFSSSRKARFLLQAM